MAKPRFSLRMLFAATAAVAMLLGSAVVKDEIAISLIVLASATMLPAVLVTGAVRGSGYLRTFCIGALIPAAWMFGLVARQTGSVMDVMSDPFGPSAGFAYFKQFCRFWLDLRYVPFGFGLASLVAGLTSVATHWLLGGNSEEERPR